MTPIEYYVSLQSPWTWLGHERFLSLLGAAGREARIHPIDVPTVFSRTGGLPLARRSPERRAWRLAELERWRRHLGVPLNLEPAHFPTDDVLASLLVMAVRDAPEPGGERGGRLALELAGRCLRAVWAQDLDLAQEATLRACYEALGGEGASALPPFEEMAARARSPERARQRTRETEEAIERGVFGVPTYVVNGELFWGQDRLDFVARALGPDSPGRASPGAPGGASDEPGGGTC